MASRTNYNPLLLLFCSSKRRTIDNNHSNPLNFIAHFTQMIPAVRCLASRFTAEARGRRHRGLRMVSGTLQRQLHKPRITETGTNEMPQPQQPSEFHRTFHPGDTCRQMFGLPSHSRGKGGEAAPRTSWFPGEPTGGSCSRR